MRKGLYIVAFASLAGLAFGIGYWFGRPSSRPPDTGVSMPRSVAVRAARRDGWQTIAAHQASPPSHFRLGGSHFPSNLPLGPFGANIDELKRRAKAGDPSAVKALADGYRRCEFFKPPLGQRDLEKRAEDTTVNSLGLLDQIVDQIKDLADKRGIKLSGIPKIDSLSAYKQQLKAETDRMEACRGIDSADASAWRTWYARAAELGDPDAQLDYWQVAFSHASMASLDELPRQKEVAAAALQSALSRGDPRALAAIGAVLEDGYFADPDLFSAHAYYFAASLAPGTDIAAFPWASGSIFARLANGNDTQTYLARRLAATAAKLEPLQVVEAERVGTDLFSRCCEGRHQ